MLVLYLLKIANNYKLTKKILWSIKKFRNTYFLSDNREKVNDIY